MGLSIGPRIGVQGSEQFRAEFKEMATVAKQLKAEMDALTSSFKENDSEMTKNGKTQEALTKRIEQQEKVVEKAKQGVELATRAQQDAVLAHEKAKDKLEDLTKKREEAIKKLDESAKKHEESKEKVQALAKTSENLAEQLVKVKNELGEESATYKVLKKSMDDVDKQLDHETKELVKNAKEHTNAQKKVDQLNSSIDRQEAKIESTAKGIAKANTVLAEYKTKEAEATEEANNLKKALEELPNKLQSFGEDLEKHGEALVAFGEGLTKVLSPLTALSGYGVKSAMTFTDALAKISTIADTSVVSLDQFGEGIKKIASDTGFATDDIAAATYQALSASVSTEKSLEFVAGAADLARAGFLDMFGSVDVLTTILNSYHKEVSEVADISDLLVKVQDRGKTTVKELASFMGNVIPTAAQYGIKLEDLGAAYVVLTRQGINTARTTTYLRSAFTELEKDGSDASKALANATGKTFVQLLANGKSLGEIMQILKDSVHGDEEAFIHLFGSIRTAAGALALANTSAEEYAEILDDVGNSTGQAARNVQKLQTPALKLKKAWEQLKTTGLDLGQEMLKVLIPYIEKLVKKVKEFTDKVKALHPTTKRLIAQFVMIGGSIGPIITGVGKAIIGMGRFAKAMGILFKATVPTIAAVGAWGTALVAVAGILAAVKVKINEDIEAKRDALKATYELTEEEREQMAVNKSLIDQSKETRASADENAKARATEADKASVLLAELRKLYDKNGEVIEGNITHAEIIKGQLADALGIEVDEIDGLIKKYGIYGKAIDETIEKKANAALADSYLESYVQESRNLRDVAAARDEYFGVVQSRALGVQSAYNDMTAAKEAFDRAQADDSLSTEEVEAYGSAWSEAKAKFEYATDAYEESYSHYQTMTKEIADGTKDLDSYMSKIKQASGMTKEQADEAVKNAGGSLSTFKDDNEVILRGLNTTVQTYMKEVDTNFTSTFNDVEKKSRSSGQNTVGNFEESLKEGEETLNAAAEKDADKTIEGLDTATKRVPSLADNWINTFFNTATSPSNLAKMFEAGYKATEASNNGAKAASKQGSPSRVWMDFANNDVEGYLIGANRRLGDMYAMGEAMSLAAMPTGWTSNYSRLPDYAYGTTNNTRNISAPIAVNVNVNGNVDDPNGLADIIEQRLVEKIINNERAFA